MALSHRATDTPTGAQATRQGKATANSKTGRRSTLESSLHGVGLRLKPQCRMLMNGYPTNDDLTLKPKSIAQDSNGLWHQILQFDPKPDCWEYNDTHTGEEGSKPADYERILKTMVVTRRGPTLIYISGHSEKTSRGELAYVPADHLTTAPKLVPYDAMRQLLLKNSSSVPLLFVTEVCYCDNFLRLPYVLAFKDNEVHWEKTGYPTLSEGSSAVVHCAATSPGERAASFESGAVFTRAFYNIDPRDELSLRDIAKRLQENVNIILAADKTNVRTQSPKVYCSQIMNDPHFFKAMGFYCPLDSDSSADGDSDSNISIRGQD